MFLIENLQRSHVRQKTGKQLIKATSSHRFLYLIQNIILRGIWRCEWQMQRGIEEKWKSFVRRVYRVGQTASKPTCRGKESIILLLFLWCKNYGGERHSLFKGVQNNYVVWKVIIIAEKMNEHKQSWHSPKSKHTDRKATWSKTHVVLVVLLCWPAYHCRSRYRCLSIEGSNFELWEEAVISWFAAF